MTRSLNDMEAWSRVDVRILTEARRVFLHCVLAWHDSYSAMVARSYAEEKVNYAFKAESIFDLRAVLDDERRAEFDKALLKWGDEHGL